MKTTTSIKIKKLEEIASYYQFPLAVFFTPLGQLRGSRRERFGYAYDALNKVKEILEEAELKKLEGKR